MHEAANGHGVCSVNDEGKRVRHVCGRRLEVGKRFEGEASCVLLSSILGLRFVVVRVAED